jgi:hypothetical protein
MPPEQDADLAREEALTLALLDLAGADSVRVIEALAAALVNDLRDQPADAIEHWSAPPAPTGLCEDGRVIRDFDCRLGLCRRIARRALRGSLTDPSRRQRLPSDRGEPRLGAGAPARRRVRSIPVLPPLRTGRG